MGATIPHFLGRRDAKGHGGGIRGADLPRRSTQFEGRFGRLFRALPSADFSNEDLFRLAHDGMTAEAKRRTRPDGKTERIATAEHQVDDEENFGIPSGYTYLGQFIDHDLTFDPVSALQGNNDPDGLTDFRTPRFDLDSLYGRGPSDQPYMFEADGRRFALGRKLTRNGNSDAPVLHDLPRAENGRAIIGDKRNDENVIVSQLHGLFMRFHNKLAMERAELPFPEIQRLVRWHYQWIILHDFLPRIVGPETLHAILPHLASRKNIFDDKPQLHFYHFRNDAYLPIEFSAAAYRFGHSMVRPIYRLSRELGASHDDQTHTVGRHFIFAGEGMAGLNGFRPFSDKWAIDWKLFFEIDATLSADNTIQKGPGRIQPSYKIDTSLVNPLDFLPEFCVTKSNSDDLLIEDDKPVAKTDPFTHMPEITNLAHRNLLRGRAMGLPSGQAVARAMGLVPMRDEDIVIGKANVADTFAGEGSVAKNRSITAFGASFKDNAPLWVYVLAEAQHQWTATARAALGAGTANDEQILAANTLPVSLGPVGGRIVAETLVGLLLADSFSFLSQEPAWRPNPAWCEETKFAMPQLIRVALSAI